MNAAVDDLKEIATLTKQSVIFRSPSDAERAHPELDRNFLLPYAERSRFKLHNEIRFPQPLEVPCQLERLGTGKKCGELHGSGWVAELDGKKGYLGGCCRRRHLAEVAELSRQIRQIQEAIAATIRLDELLTFVNRADFQEIATATFNRAEALLLESRVVSDALPKRVVAALSDRRKRGAADVLISVRYEDRDQHGIVGVEWKPTRVGTLQGLEAFNQTRVISRVTKAQQISKTLADAREATDPDAMVLKAWLKVLKGADARIRDLDSLEASLRAFRQPNNLQLLMFIGYEKGVLEAVIDSICDLAHEARLPRPDLPGAVRTWEESVRTAHGGRRFKAA